MKVILTQAVPGLGDAGTIKEVADGYARNYLLPRKLAIVATKGTVKQAEMMAEQYAHKANKARSEVEKAAAAIEGKVVRLRARTGSENRLYGSITPNDLADALKSQYGITLDRRKIELSEPIHRLGTYNATADLGSGVTATFGVEVLAEVPGAHGKSQAVKGEAAEAAAQTPEAAAPESEEEEVLEEAEANPS